MSKLTDIKRKILELEGGAFQELCDALLSRKGYDGIHAYGMHAGSMKTTIGNPDTYFKNSEGKYIFVAYTTQSGNVFEKAKEDIEKCLDVEKTGVEKSEIEKIIFCHTSSNLSAGKDQELLDLCKKEGVLFEIYGIDRIADEIYRNYKILAKDHLAISIDTNQIMDLRTFIEQYDMNEMAAPLATRFQFREIEYREIVEVLSQVKFVAVVGQAGVGKSRLSLEVVKRYGTESDRRVLCIRSMDLPILEDISTYIESQNKYLLFIDDANELIGLNYVLEYLNRYDVKIIATMRDYTAESVIRQIKQHTIPHVKKLNRLTDEEIKKFLDINMGIRNSYYVDRIIKIAEGNARLAYMSGELAKHQNLESINDATDLYENYYGNMLYNSPIIAEKELCVTASIVALLHTINLDELSSLGFLLDKINMSVEEFKSNVYRLFNLEFIDVKLDKVAIISDQCLGNYLLLHCFFLKKHIIFSEILELGFRNFRQGIIAATSVLWNIFSSADLHSYLDAEIKKVWDVFEKESEQIFIEYVKVFHDFRPVDALLFVKEIIENTNDEISSSTELDFFNANYQKKDDILELLSGYRNNENLQIAIELICKYIEKRQNAVKAASECITNYYGINKYSNRNDYVGENIVLSTLEKQRESDVSTRLYLAIAGYFLQSEFELTEPSRGCVVWSRIPLELTEGSEQYREKIWDELVRIAELKEWQNDIYEILQKYTQHWGEQSREILLFDQSYILALIKKLDTCSEIKKVDLYNQLLKKWKYYEIPMPENSISSDVSDIYNLYKIFFDEDLDQDEEVQEAKIAIFAKNVSTTEIEKIVRELNVFAKELSGKKYKLNSSIAKFANSILSVREKLVTFVHALINYGDNIDIHPVIIIKQLNIFLGEEETYRFINQQDFEHINQWNFVLFESLSIEKINEIWQERLIQFLKSDSDKFIKSSSYRNLSFLENYLSIDPEFFCKCTEIILAKKHYNDFIVHIYFDLFFNEHCQSPEILYKYFKSNEDLLKKIYFFMLEYDEHTDYSGVFIKYFISKNPEWIQSYAQYFYNSTEQNRGYQQDRIVKCWELENCSEVFDCLFDYIAKNEQPPYWRVRINFSNILVDDINTKNIGEKQKTWIIDTIHKNYNNEKIFLLFEVLSELGPEVRIAAIRTFTSLNNDIKVFNNLVLEPNHWGGFGSMITYMQPQVKYYESLLSIFTGLEFLQHKKIIEDKIQLWKRMIAQEEIEEIMKQRF